MHPLRLESNGGSEHFQYENITTAGCSEAVELKDDESRSRFHKCAAALKYFRLVPGWAACENATFILDFLL